MKEQYIYKSVGYERNEPGSQPDVDSADETDTQTEANRTPAASRLRSTIVAASAAARN